MKKVPAFGIIGICILTVAFLEAQENQPLESPTSDAQAERKRWVALHQPERRSAGDSS
jgi:hypothetical protein